MTPLILTKTYSEPPFCKKEILRYAGSKIADESLHALLNDCIDEARSKLHYKVAYCELPCTVKDDICDFNLFKVKSNALAFNLKGCKKVILFAATVGIGIDRLIARYSPVSPARALMFQAIGTERIEALGDIFCEDIARESAVGTKPRFSPGYGDVPLETQADIFALLNCSKSIGLTLTDSLLMSPSKSITAFMGLTNEVSRNSVNKCCVCTMQGCSFRGIKCASENS